MIKKVYNTNLEKNYFDEKENFKSIIELLRIIGMKLNYFEKLKITRYENLDEHINQKILC